MTETPLSFEALKLYGERLEEMRRRFLGGATRLIELPV